MALMKRTHIIWILLLVISRVSCRRQKPQRDEIERVINKTHSIIWKCSVAECPLGMGLSVPCGTSVPYSVTIECVNCVNGANSSATHDYSQCKSCMKCSANEETFGHCTTTEDTTTCLKACHKGFYWDNVTDSCNSCSDCCGENLKHHEEQCEKSGLPISHQCRQSHVICRMPTANTTKDYPTDYPSPNDDRNVVPNDDPKQRSLSSNEIAGIMIGCILFAIIVLSVVIWMFCGWHRGKTNLKNCCCCCNRGHPKVPTSTDVCYAEGNYSESAPSLNKSHSEVAEKTGFFISGLPAIKRPSYHRMLSVPTEFNDAPKAKTDFHRSYSDPECLIDLSEDAKDNKPSSQKKCLHGWSLTKKFGKKEHFSVQYHQAPPPKIAAPSVAPQHQASSPEVAVSVQYHQAPPPKIAAPSVAPQHQAATAPGPSADGIYSPMATQYKMKNIATATMKFEAEHEECVRVLPYLKGDQVMVQFYVFSGESGVPEQLKLDAEECFGEMELKWSDLYNDAANILKVTTVEYPSGEPKRLNASQVDEISEIISQNLHELEKHRNVTSVQASFKITKSKQTENPCITIYVLGKGFVPMSETDFPRTLGPYPVDVVDGFWFKTNNLWFPNKAQEQCAVLRLGASIGVQGEKASGTLGAIVEDNGTFYVLSCDHVMKHPTKSEIIHPGLNDHLNYLKYHLDEYRNRIKGIVEHGVLEEGINFSVNSLGELNELSEKFEELKSIKGRHVNSTRCNDRKLEYIMFYEEALKKRLNPPRVIGEYILPGVFGNVKWTDDKEYFIDVAIAKLTPEEVNSLRESGTVETVGPNVNWGDNVECSPTTTTAIMDARELFKYGRTTGYTTTDRVIDAWVAPPQFMLDSPKVQRYQDHPLPDMKMDTYFCHSCDTIQPTRCCEFCQVEAKPDSSWRKNCLCIDRGKKDFIDSGDSGAVIFELKEERILGFGIIFAEHYSGYFRYAIASPLQVALKALSKTISEDSNLRLVSNFENIPTYPMKVLSTVPLNQSHPPDVLEVAVPGPNVSQKLFSSDSWNGIASDVDQ